MDLLVRCRTGYTEYRVGVGSVVGCRMPGGRAAGTVPGRLVQSEASVSDGEELELAAVHRAIRPREREQGGQHILQHAPVVGESVSELGSIGPISFGAVACLVEQVADVAHGFRRNAELAFEGVDFLALHWAVAFGELGRQHNNTYGEELVTAMQHRGEAGGVDAGLLAQLLAKVRHGTGIGRVPERRADNSAHWAAHGEARHAADDLAPVAHGAMVTRCGKESRFRAEGLVEPRRRGLRRETTTL